MKNEIKVSYNLILALHRYNRLYPKGKPKNIDIVPEDLKYVHGYLQTRSFMRILESTGKLEAKLDEIKLEMSLIKPKFNLASGIPIKQ